MEPRPRENLFEGKHERAMADIHFIEKLDNWLKNPIPRFPYKHQPLKSRKIKVKVLSQ